VTLQRLENFHELLQTFALGEPQQNFALREAQKTSALREPWKIFALRKAQKTIALREPQETIALRGPLLLAKQTHNNSVNTTALWGRSAPLWFYILGVLQQ